jgi:hypothetical protein
MQLEILQMWTGPDSEFVPVQAHAEAGQDFAEVAISAEGNEDPCGAFMVMLTGPS